METAYDTVGILPFSEHFGDGGSYAFGEFDLQLFADKICNEVECSVRAECGDVDTQIVRFGISPRVAGVEIVVA